MKTRANILSDKISDKMDELKFKLRTMDGGSCLTHMPVEENTKMKQLMQKKRAALGRKSSQSNQPANEPGDISQMTPY